MDKSVTKGIVIVALIVACAAFALTKFNVEEKQEDGGEDRATITHHYEDGSYVTQDREAYFEAARENAEMVSELETPFVSVSVDFGFEFEVLEIVNVGDGWIEVTVKAWAGDGGAVLTDTRWAKNPDGNSKRDSEGNRINEYYDLVLEPSSRIGFGENGDKELLLLKIFNPKVSVAQIPEGDVISNGKIRVVDVTLEKNPKARLVNKVEEIVERFGKDGSNIVEGEVHTITIEYWGTPGMRSVSQFIGTTNENDLKVTERIINKKDISQINMRI